MNTIVFRKHLSCSSLQNINTYVCCFNKCCFYVVRSSGITSLPSTFAQLGWGAQMQNRTRADLWLVRSEGPAPDWLARPRCWLTNGTFLDDVIDPTQAPRPLIFEGGLKNPPKFKVVRMSWNFARTKAKVLANQSYHFRRSYSWCLE